MKRLCVRCSLKQAGLSLVAVGLAGLLIAWVLTW